MAGRPPVDRSLPPPAREIRPFHFPPFLRARLPNGLTVVAARQAGYPVLTMDLISPAGAQYDSSESSGIATLTASVIDEGTTRRSAMEIAAAAECVGGYFSSGADWDVGYLSTGLLASHRQEGLEMLAEVLTSPTFPEGEVDRLRRQRLAELLRRRQDPAAVADDRFQHEVFRGTIYAQPLHGTQESVSRLTRESLLSFYRGHYGFDGSTLIAVGDFDPEDLLREAAAVFGSEGPPGPAPARPEISPVPLREVEVHLVDRPGAAQTELRLGHVGIPRTHPDYIPLLVLNTLLGGKFTSRINLNLRERHSYTYGASSRFSSRQGPGPFTVTAAVETTAAGPAAVEVLREIRRIRETLVEPEELTETRSYIVGVFPYSMQTISDVTRRLETLAIFGLPDDYYDRYLEKIAAVTAEEIREVARRHLDPERTAVVAVGPAEILEPQFEGLGPVTVWSPEGEPRAAQPVRSI
ncbi:MAG: M16 family metallopeptidase [Thermoanaerobaculia bacterium]